MDVDDVNKLATETRRVMADRKWSFRNAEIRTGVKSGTVHNMSIGKNVGPQFLIQWADAIGEPRSNWLSWGNHNYLAKDAEKSETAKNVFDTDEPPAENVVTESPGTYVDASGNVRRAESADEVEYEPVYEELIEAGLNEISGDPESLERLKEYIRFEVHKHHQSQTTHGKRAK